MARSLSIALVIATSACWRPPAAGSAPPRPEPAPVAPSIAIVGATLWDGTGRAPVPNAVTLVRGDRILCAGAAGECPIPAGARVIDAHGQYLIPGLIDSHVHLLFLTSGSAGEELGLDLRNLLAQGVTTVRDMGTNPAELLARVRRSSAAPRVYAMQLVAGPPVLLQRLPRRQRRRAGRSTASRRRMTMQPLGWKPIQFNPDDDPDASSTRRARPAPWGSSSTPSWIRCRSGGSPRPPTAPACRCGVTPGCSPRACWSRPWPVRTGWCTPRAWRESSSRSRSATPW